MSRPRVAFGLAAALYFLLTVALTWPLALHPGSRVPNDLGDSLLNMFLLAWDARELPFTAHWWNLPQFYPIPGTMAFSEHLLGLSVITTPIIAATGNVLLCVQRRLLPVVPALRHWRAPADLSDHPAPRPGAGRGARLRVRAVSHGAVRTHPGAVELLDAVLAARAAPVRRSSRGGGTSRSSPPPGICRRSRAATTCSTSRCWLACGCCGSPSAAFAGPISGAWCWPGASPSRRSCRSRTATSNIKRAYGLRRWPDEIQAFSADVASVLTASGNLRLWGWLQTIDRPESSLFPGLAIILVIIAGIVLAWAAAAHDNMQRLRATRLLLLGATLFGLIASAPLWYGPIVVELFGIRLLSVRTPQKPFSLAVLLAVIALRHASVHPRGLAPPLGARVLLARGGGDVAALPRAGADVHGQAVTLQGAVRVADAHAWRGGRARAGAGSGCSPRCASRLRRRSRWATSCSGWVRSARR